MLQALGKISKTDMKLRLAQLVLARKAKAMNAKARQGLCLLADCFRFCALLVSECLFAGHQAATVAAAEAQPPPDELELEPEPEPAAGARGSEDEGPCLLILSILNYVYVFWLAYLCLFWLFGFLALFALFVCCAFSRACFSACVLTECFWDVCACFFVLFV